MKNNSELRLHLKGSSSREAAQKSRFYFICPVILLLLTMGLVVLAFSGCALEDAGDVPGDVPVTGAFLSKSRIYLLTTGPEHHTKQLSGTVIPPSATNKSFTWSTSDEAVASVSADGLVTGETVGSATITITTEDGSFTATCLATVRDTPSFQIFFDAGDIPFLSFDFDTEEFSPSAFTPMNDDYRTNIFIMHSDDIEPVTDHPGYPEPFDDYYTLPFDISNEVFSSDMEDGQGSLFTIDVIPIADIDPATDHFIGMISWDSKVFGKGRFPGDDDLDFGDLENAVNYYLTSLYPPMGGNPEALFVGLCVVSDVDITTVVDYYNLAQDDFNANANDWVFLYDYQGTPPNNEPLGYWKGQPVGLHKFTGIDVTISNLNVNAGYIDASALISIYQHFD